MSDPTSLPNFPPPADEHPLRGRVLDVLVDAGAQPNLDTDGDVAYQANEQTIFVRVTEGELPVMRVFGQWTLPDEVASDTRQGLGHVQRGQPLAQLRQDRRRQQHPRRHERAPRRPRRRGRRRSSR